MEGAARPEERREDTDGKRYLRSEFEDSVTLLHRDYRAQRESS